MKQIEVNTHSERIELETGSASSVIDRLETIYKVPLTYYTENEDCVKYTELGQSIFNDIGDVMSKYIKVKEE